MRMGADRSREWASWRAVDCYVNERIITEHWQLWSLGKTLNQTKLHYSHLHLQCFSPSHTPSILIADFEGSDEGRRTRWRRKSWDECEKSICLLATLISAHHLTVSGGKKSHCRFLCIPQSTSQIPPETFPKSVSKPPYRISGFKLQTTALASKINHISCSKWIAVLVYKAKNHTDRLVTIKANVWQRQPENKLEICWKSVWKNNKVKQKSFPHPHFPFEWEIAVWA